MQEKILTHSNLRAWLAKQSEIPGKLIFTNGCFDLLHVGHIHYLRQAAALGKALIVGVNDDDSVSRLKGPQRPLNKLQDRMQMLAALDSIDAVIPFSEDTPESLIQLITPDILVKGGDYTVDEVVGGKHVIANGGEVIILDFLQGYSSTSLIEKIKNNL